MRKSAHASRNGPRLGRWEEESEKIPREARVWSSRLTNDEESIWLPLITSPTTRSCGVTHGRGKREMKDWGGTVLTPSHTTPSCLKRGYGADN